MGIQQLLHICSEHYEQDKGETEKKDGDKKGEDEKKEEEGPLDLSGQQAVAVLGLGLISMGEDIGSEMLIRTLSHLMRYSEPVIRRAVPLALALVSISNPQLHILQSPTTSYMSPTTTYLSPTTTYSHLPQPTVTYYNLQSPTTTYSHLPQP